VNQQKGVGVWPLSDLPVCAFRTWRAAIFALRVINGVPRQYNQTAGNKIRESARARARRRRQRRATDYLFRVVAAVGAARGDGSLLNAARWQMTPAVAIIK